MKKLIVGFAVTMALMASVAVYANSRHDGNCVGSGALIMSSTGQNLDFKYVRDVRLYIYNANISQYVYLQTEKLYQDSRGQLFVTYAGGMVRVMDTTYLVRPYFRYCFFGIMGTMCYFN